MNQQLFKILMDQSFQSSHAKQLESSSKNFKTLFTLVKSKFEQPQLQALPKPLPAESGNRDEAPVLANLEPPGDTVVD